MSQPVSAASAERSSSIMKTAKTHSRSTMPINRHSHLCLLSSKCEMTGQLINSHSHLCLLSSKCEMTGQLINSHSHLCLLSSKCEMTSQLINSHSHLCLLSPKCEMTSQLIPSIEVIIDYFATIKNGRMQLA